MTQGIYKRDKNWKESMQKKVWKNSDRNKKISNSRKGKYFRLGYKHTEEIKKKIGLGNKGKIVSQETRKKMSDSHKGQKAWNKGKKLSKENCEAISRSRVNKKKVRCATTGKSFESMMDADKRFNLPAGSVSKVCNGKRKSTHGLTFEFIMEVTHSVD